MYLTQPLHKALQEKPTETMLICGARRKTFEQVVDRVSRLAGALQSLGVKQGDRVSMMSLNSDRFIEYFYAVWWAGAVVNPVNIRWSPKEIAYSLDDCDTKILLVDDAFKDAVTALRELSTSLATVVYVGEGETPEGMLNYESLIASAEPRTDAMRKDTDLAAVMYTGGTTGVPKGVMLSHGNIYIDSLGGLAAVPRRAESTGVIAVPLFHIGGLAFVVQLSIRLGTQVLVPAFDPVAVMQAIQNERATELFLVPIMLKRVLEDPGFPHHDLASLRLVLYGAAPIDETLLDQALLAFHQAEFVQAYGMTELSPSITALPAWCHQVEGRKAGKLRSAGLPLPMAEVRIVDPQGNTLPCGVVGEIAARGPMVMQGYWNKPEETAKALRDGWMHTGDGGYIDSDGFVYVVDRLKDMIVTGGENVYSAEVENTLGLMPEISMCAVIGVPDEKWGERVHAVIVLHAGTTLDADSVIKHCKTVIAGYKCPRSVEFRKELPLSAAGKLLKFQLREPYWRGRARQVA